VDPTSLAADAARVVALPSPGTSVREIRAEVAQADADLPRGHRAKIVAVPKIPIGPATPPGSGLVVVDTDDQSSAAVISDMLRSGLYAAVDYEAQAQPHFTDTPNDPYFTDPESWGLKSHPGGAFNTAWTELSDAEGTWNTAPIASIDTGFSMAAADRGSNIQAGWDYGENDADVTPLPGITDGQHGTGTAGIMGAATNNGIGGAGATWNNQILVYKAADVAGALQYSAITESILAATNAGAKVITMSLGSPDFPSYVQAAIDQAIARGITVIASAGNDAQSTANGVPNPVQYPAAYDPVISVGAVDDAGSWASFSTFNSGVDIAAPGVGILVMDQDFSGGYAVADGTSEAAPFVAATAALMLRERPGLSAAQVLNVLCSTASDVTAAPASPGKDPYTGCGTVNAHAAVVGARTAPIMPTFAPQAGGVIQATAGDAVSLDLGVSGDPAPHVEVDDNTPLPIGIALHHDGANWVLRGQAQQAGSFTIAVIADSLGEQATLPVAITVNPGPANQVRAVPSAFHMKNTGNLSVVVEGTDSFGNPVTQLSPHELASAQVRYSIKPKCQFKTGKKPSYRVCTISVHYSGTLQPAPETVHVYDTKQFTVSIAGVPDIGRKLTASVPRGWKGLTYHWLMNGHKIVGATDRTYVIPKTVPKNAKFQVVATIPGVAAKKATSVELGKAIPTITVKPSSNTLTVRIKAAGIKAATGAVVLHYRGHKAKHTLKASDKGVLKVKMPDGKYKVSIQYLGRKNIAKKSVSARTYSF
jgi:thermitase